MAFRSPAVCTLIALLLSGCGGPAQMQIQPSDNPSFGPNEGLVGMFPSAKPFEIVSEPAGNLLRFIVYFYEDESMESPRSPAPTDVRIDLAMPDGSMIPIDLKPASGSDSKFASTPGDYLVDPMIGTLTATVEGEIVSAPFSGAFY